MSISPQILLLLLSTLCESSILLNYRLFSNLDRNNDGILTHSQFINGLNRAFVALGIESDKVNTNNFAREFLGEKLSDGRVFLKDIESWVSTGELVRSYEEWKILNDEGELHFDPNHKHGSEGRPRFRRAPAIKHKKDL